MKKGFVLRLVATRCLDGIEIIQRDFEPGFLKHPDYGSSGAMWFSCRSDRYERTTIRDMSGLADTLVVRFVNAADDDRRIAFVSRFGLPLSAFPSEPYEWILGEQKVLRRLLDHAGRGDPETAIKAANQSLSQAQLLSLSLQSDGRMVLNADSPMTFMHLEIALVATSGARLTTCENCGDVFLTGSLTARRSTARYCRDRCRVNAHRAKNGD